MLQAVPMSRSLRALLLGSIVIAYAYLIWHAREPLRLNVGDPWSDANVLSSINYVKSDGFLATSFTDILDVGPLTADSYRYIHYPPFSEIIYGAIGKYLGVSDIGTFRLFGLSFSLLAMWLLFSYVRRLYTDRIALIATAMYSTSLLWMMYADSMHQAPVMQCTGFLALWGLVRAIETKQKRHYAAAILGSAACFFTSYDYWLFLPTGVLMTVYLQKGNPFAKGNRHFVVLCAFGCMVGVLLKCLAVIGAVGWDEFLADLHMQFLERATSTHDRYFSATLPTLWRRMTLVFSPFAWVTVGYHVLRAIRATTPRAALRDTPLWMILTAVAFLYVFRQLATSQMLPAQVLLPFYAIGTALIVDRMLEARRPWRILAHAWLVAAPLWAFFIMFTHPRSVLAREDVAATNAYLADHDQNDFVLSNLLSDGHIQATFQRHSLGMLDADDTSSTPLQMMALFELTGTEYVHAIIFHDANSRFIDKSLWVIAAPRKIWSVTGWPHLFRKKTTAMIAAYDRRIMANLSALEAQRVLELSNYSVYRIDRKTVKRQLDDRVKRTDHLDFGNLVTQRSLMLGWEAPSISDQTGVASAAISGYTRCPHERCATKLTKFGITVKHETFVNVGELLLRVDRLCDQRLTFELANKSFVRVSARGFEGTILGASKGTITIPASAFEVGVNVVEVTNLVPMDFRVGLEVVSLDIAPQCPAP